MKNNKKANIDYDIENDSLFIFSENKKINYSHSEVIDNSFIVDINKENQISGLEVLNCSKKLSISKKLLSSIQNFTMNIRKEEEKLTIELQFQFKQNKIISQKDILLEKITSTFGNSNELKLSF